MAFISGPMTDSNAPKALYDLMEPQMLAIGWLLEDTVVLGVNTHKVFKSPAAGNAIGLDFWIIIRYTTTGNGTIAFANAEGYNVATHAATRPSFTPSGSTVEQVYFSALGTTPHALNHANVFYVALGTVATASFYSISMTRNRIVGQLLSSGMVYCGLFTPTAEHAAWAGAALFPLINTSFIQGFTGIETSSGGTGLTRMPRMPTGTQTWSNYGAGSTHADGLHSGIVGGAVSPVTGKRILVNALVYYWYNPATSADYLWFGWIEDVASGYTIGSAAKGDTVTIGPDTWVVGIAPASSLSTGYFKAS